MDLQPTIPARPLVKSPIRMGAGCTVFILTLITTGPTAPAASDIPAGVARCVPCHHRTGRDQVGEWLASPYSAIEGGLPCVGCHVSPCRGDTAGGPSEDRRPGTNLEAVRASVRLSLASRCDGDEVEAEVSVTNLGAGHLLPTGPAGGTITLEVSAHDLNENPLQLSKGQRLSTPSRGSSGTAGKTFGTEPSSPDPRKSANALAPFATDVSRYRFVSPGEWPVRVSARLVITPTGGTTFEITETASICGGSGPKP